MRKADKKQGQYRWKVMVAVLACVVGISTVAALVLPAIALDKKCTLEEHQHTQECYVWVGEAPKPEDGPLMQGTEAAAETVAEEAPEDETTQRAEQPEDLPTGEWKLICQIPEHTHTDECRRPANEAEETDADAAVSVEETPAEEPRTTENAGKAEAPADDSDTEEKTPIDVEKYVVEAKLRYKEKKGGGQWQDLQPDVPVPGDAKLRLEIDYAHIRISRLIARGCQLRFTVPEIMRDPVAQGDIKSDNETVGNITVVGDVLTMTFHENWLRRLQNSSDGYLVGDFYVESDINLSKIPPDGSGLDLTFGPVTIQPTFDTNAIAKYGKLEVLKTMSKHLIVEGGVHCLEYTLTVRAGVDGSPDVTVVDHFIMNGDHVEYVNLSTTPAVLTESGIPKETILEGQTHGMVYKGALPTEQTPIPPADDPSVSEPGSLVWVIGNMDANEERTLTYRVKMLDHKVEVVHDRVLRNEAGVYSKHFKKNTSAVDFRPKVDLGMKKSNAAPQRNPQDGSYRIPYTVWFEAPNSNNHVLDMVQVTDSLARTDERARAYIHYDESSFKLYPAKRPGGTALEVNKEGQEFPKLVYAPDKKSFTLSVGDMNPGTAYSFQYDLIVDAKAFGAMNTESLSVNNRVEATSSNASLPDKNFLQAYNQDVNIGYQHWVKKAVEQPLDAAITVDLPQEHVYDATGGSIVADPNKPQSFTVPAGSYPYSITINDLGDWVVTQATVKDVLNSQYAQYAGYLQVTAYDTKQAGSDPLGTPVESRWLKIDGLRSFQLQLAQIGFPGNSHAYRFKYYVMPVNVGDISKVIVSNTAGFNGPVGRDGETFQVGEFGSRVEVTMQGGHAFEARKYPWFYEKPKATAGLWSKGAIYWGIKIDGTELHAGTIIRDFVKKEWPHHERGDMFFHDDSFVGIYQGKLPDGEQFTDYGDLQSLIDKNYFTEIPADEYCEVTYEDNRGFHRENTYSDVFVTMKKSVPIGEENSVFLILRSEPADLPTGVRTHKNYTNYLDTGENKDALIPGNMATKVLYGGQNILKEFSEFVEFDGEKITELQAGKGGHIPAEGLPAPGHYIAWTVKVNYGGDMAGRYRVVDEIPQGTEAAFARMKWLGGKTRNQNVQMYRIADYQTVLGPEWTEHVITAEMDENLGPSTSYYYTNGRQVLWEVDHLVAGHVRDDYAVDFQIVCRVTDPDVLQGGMEKEFMNQVFLQTTDGEPLDTSSSGVRVSVSNIDKSAQTAGNTIHFSIDVNPSGEDLIRGEDTVTLVDEMSETLGMDVESIAVVNTKTKQPVEFRASLDGQTLSVILPDGQPLTITYTAHVHAVPDTIVTLSNKAYWMGYSSQSGDSVQIKDFHYKIGGTAGGVKSPSVQILKYDKNDITSHLAGAEFRMEEGTMKNGVFTANGNVWTGVTGSDGLLTFGTDQRENQQMHYNVVYRVTEIGAPDGYLLDPEPHYFIIAGKVNDKYPPYPEGVHVHYASTTHTFKAPNSKGEAYIQKQFRGADGTEINAIPGRYRFGLFDNAQGTGQPLQTVVLNFMEGSTGADVKGTFVDLRLDTTYYVFELDETGNPILPDALGYVNGTPFRVEYRSDSGKENHAVTHGSTVTVTNQTTVESLPETGGRGTALFTVGGLTLMGGALGSAYVCGRRRKHAATEK